MAKSTDRHHTIQIMGRLSKNAVERKVEESLDAWSQIRFAKQDDFYRNIMIQHYYANSMNRDTRFYFVAIDSFVRNYEKDTFTLILRQKLDKLDWVSFDIEGGRKLEQRFQDYLAAKKKNDEIIVENEMVPLGSSYEIKLHSIIFNFDQSSNQKASVNIRKTLSQSMKIPEWKYDYTKEDKDINSKAVYCMSLYWDTAANKPKQAIKLKAKFYSLSNVDKPIFIKAFSNGVLGSSEVTKVNFKGKESDYFEFIFNNHRIGESGVNKVNISLQWYDNESIAVNETSHSIGGTNHVVYSIINMPTPPWSEIYSEDNTQLAWTDALDVACDWAKQTTNVGQAAEAITRRLNTLKVAFYQSGYGFVTADRKENFMLSNFIVAYNACKNLNPILDTSSLPTDLSDLFGGEQSVTFSQHVMRMNCTDCATIVSTLANLLGCDLCQVEIDTFSYNKIIPIGYEKLGDDKKVFSGSFGYHEIAWTGAWDANNVNKETLICDATLKIIDSKNELTIVNMPYQEYIKKIGADVNTVLKGPLSTTNHGRRTII